MRSCVAEASFSSTSPARAHRKTYLDGSLRTRALRPRAGKGHAALELGMPSAGLTSPFDEVDRLGDVIVLRCGPSTIFTPPRCPPDQGRERSRSCYPAGATRGVGTPPVPRARCLAPASATNLLSRAPVGTRHSQVRRSHAANRFAVSRDLGRSGISAASRAASLRRPVTVSGQPNPERPGSWTLLRPAASGPSPLAGRLVSQPTALTGFFGLPRPG